MRLATGLLASAFSLIVLGCSGGDGGLGGDDEPDADDRPPPPEHGFQIVTPDLEILAGQEITYCYYTTVRLDQAAGIKRWSSTMAPGSHHLIVYFTETRQRPDGTIDTSCGGVGGGLNVPVWTYAAQTPEAEFTMPEGVGMHVAAEQPLFVQMHYFNAHPTQAIDAHVVINAETHAPGVAYERAAAYVTFNTQINLPPNGAGEVEGSCAVPAGAKFFTMSTHAHRRATRTEVRDGDTVIFESEDWEHPGSRDWKTAPHYTFAGRLNYRCEYQNDLNEPVGTGDSADTDEMCMAVGYFFPATRQVFCLNSSAF
jgi:hypothetical protein